MTGKKIKAPAKRPKAPTPDFRSLTQPVTVCKASPKALPTTGTKLLTTNLAAFAVVSSIEDATMLCTVSKPANTVIQNPSTHLTTL